MDHFILKVSKHDRVTHQIREDVKKANGKKIDEANNETEYWKVVNDITKPNNNSKWKLKNDKGEDIEDEKEIAETFNSFFVTKIENLKATIDESIKDDPLKLLKKKVENKNLNFCLKTVTVKTVTKVMNQFSNIFLNYKSYA